MVEESCRSWKNKPYKSKMEIEMCCELGMIYMVRMELLGAKMSVWRMLDVVECHMCVYVCIEVCICMCVVSYCMC